MIQRLFPQILFNFNLSVIKDTFRLKTDMYPLGCIGLWLSCCLAQHDNQSFNQPMSRDYIGAGIYCSIHGFTYISPTPTPLPVLSLAIFITFTLSIIAILHQVMFFDKMIFGVSRPYTSSAMNKYVYAF